jgi:hypothetical protein
VSSSAAGEITPTPPTHLPSADQRARIELESRKEEKKLEKLKLVLSQKLKEQNANLCR